MGRISRSIACLAFGGVSVLAGQMAYRDKQVRDSLPRKRIHIGDEKEKKAVVIGNLIRAQM